MRFGGAAEAIAAVWPAWRRVAGPMTAVVVLVVLAAVTTRLALAPIHGVHDASACARAYAAARTRADTLSVDALSYPDTTGGRTRGRCLLLRRGTLDLSRR